MANNDHISPWLVQGWAIPRLVFKVSPDPGHLMFPDYQDGPRIWGLWSTRSYIFPRWLFIINWHFNKCHISLYWRLAVSKPKIPIFKRIDYTINGIVGRK